MKRRAKQRSTYGLKVYVSDAVERGTPIITAKTVQQVVDGNWATLYSYAEMALEAVMAGLQTILPPPLTKDSTSNRGKTPPTSESLFMGLGG